MKNWVSATGHRAWSRVKHTLRVILGYPRALSSRSTPLHGGLQPIRSKCHPRDPSCCRSRICVTPDLCPKPVAVGDPKDARQPDPSELFRYLTRYGNHIDDISKVYHLLRMPRVLLEVGCGSGEAANRIALKNPEMGVIATDLYDCAYDPANGSNYNKIARLWCARQLPTQQEVAPNLVFLRARADLLHCLPAAAIDTIILINPETLVGQAFIQLL